MTKILFLDQSGKPGGAELCLLDIAKPYRDTCLVSLFVDGPFRQLLEKQQIPVQILATKAIGVRKESGLLQGLSSIRELLPAINRIANLSRNYDLIYANTQKSLVIGAIASFLSRRPLVYHLHDILSLDHFSATNRRIAVTLANRAALVIANSQASQAAFIAAGGRKDIVECVYNGFNLELYQHLPAATAIKQQLGIEEDKFVVGNFSRLSPWKGQHILLEALTHCPEKAIALLIGDALFGEQDYVQKLHAQVAELNLEHRVKFLGFRNDVTSLMATCDMVTHTSTIAEPFGRVIVEAMLCGTPIVATSAGGAQELVESGKTGLLVAPGDVKELAAAINTCIAQPEQSAKMAQAANVQARQRFDGAIINQQIAQLLSKVIKK
ncbi:glycosyltransferase family 4 protein [Synechocystis sp. PCC 7509]|uniref:glycosyltransferase family 4 protein n=1 Tax=Synechocystis sp. PCC 7509 TaxID=927677 RepID=UPI0002ACEA63|nr:glycosyltransferase family 4 protein [Synechocystis sp. PCC 7509]